ncbi:MAG: nickel pincer cofactor biosynthesis protein LarC [Deltaproteobacteria bacterium]|nr:nickel pincer cofactor biosynthesis protein LarC [Deltaproteobacteria bacterium]MBW2050994.1 nickel pincer cofactor biosynthesis protein LarC [Deltaproteobacteria bacterium]MBW2141871.1 nickel pincer cofactor biosynthesis protein LarC [Deltaproteobacteria bacterium]MBW2323389.1 nickel pincer cofactor biosynthesis protein LarC [Deltaproteobacteria bacterium]
MTTIAFADCSAGVSGDMFLAACLDLGLPLETLERELAKIDLSGYRLEAWTELKQGLTARRFQVHIETKEHIHRAHKDIQSIITGGGLSTGVKTGALAIFDRLARVEGRIHGVDPAEVLFHEVGSVDSIIDVVGACIAMEYHGISKLCASPLPLGSGWVRSAHGRLPLPAPATLALLEGIPAYGTSLEAELVTPTGAAILTHHAAGFGPLPAMTIMKTGYGAGTRDLPDRPNLMRLVLGQADEEAARNRLIVAETNLDDMNPEILPYIMNRLFEAGALDVWLTSIQMKKGRPGVTLSLLGNPGDIDNLLEIVLAESSTLGVKTYPVERRSLPRDIQTLETPWGEIAVKSVTRGGRTELVPEYEVCRRIAQETGLPLKEVYDRIKTLSVQDKDQ